MMTPKTRRRMPWRKVGHDLYTDAVAQDLSGLALNLRIFLEARSMLDDNQLVDGACDDSVGWVMTEAGKPQTTAGIARIVNYPCSEVEAALAELVEAGIAVRSDTGAWGSIGWAHRQEDESTERKRKEKERARNSGGTAAESGRNARAEERGETGEGDEEKKTEDPELRAAASAQLVATLAELHPATADPSQRWKPKNRSHLEAAATLLALDSDLGWFDEVVDIVTDFSAICAQDREEAKFWLAPRMLAIVPAPKSTSGKSAWDTIRSVVASWRAERRIQEQEAHQRREQGRAAERQRVADRMAELENLARNGEPAFARQLRESGQKSTPVVDYKACLSAAQEAIADARRGGRDPTLEDIERAVSKSQRGGT